SADQRRRRPGPVRTSIRPYSPFASSLTSNIRIARSPLPQPNPALPRRSLKKGGRAPLTVNRGFTIDEIITVAEKGGYQFGALGTATRATFEDIWAERDEVEAKLAAEQKARDDWCNSTS